LGLAIEVKNIQKTFKSAPAPVQALRGVTTTFHAGAMHGVIGPEGAGKTTLFRTILSLLKPTGGQVQFMQDGFAMDFEQIRASVAYMPQTQSLYPDLSIAEHLDFFRALYQIPQDVYESRRHELLHITRLDQFQDRPAGKLSGGMYKKLGLMCALLRSPNIMLLDEPTNGVDPISRREFWELLYRLTDQGILIVVATAYMDEAERCGHVHLLDSGLLITDGEPRQLLDHEKVRSFDELFLKRAASHEENSRAARITGDPS